MSEPQGQAIRRRVAAKRAALQAATRPRRLVSRILHDEVWWRDLSSRAIGTAIGTGTGAAGALLLAFVSGIVASPFGPLAFAAVVVLAVLVGAAVRVTRRPRG